MVNIYRNLIAKISILCFAAKLFNRPIPDSQKRYRDSEGFSNEAKEPFLQQSYMRISYIGGTISKEDQLRFTRFLFRATRGKAFPYFEELKISAED